MSPGDWVGQLLLLEQQDFPFWLVAHGRRGVPFRITEMRLRQYEGGGL